MRLRRGYCLFPSSEFQFTHPGRGATFVCLIGGFLSIRFNSRTPGGVRHFHVIIGRYLDSVSIHAPREGCDPNLAKAPVILLMFQFTHPGRGATLAYIFDSALSERFNSRTPGGVRLLVNPFRLLAYQFQFTHPGRGATISKSLPTPRLSVSIHAPREGCDLSEDSLISSEQSFNSRTPGGVRPDL